MVLVYCRTPCWFDLLVFFDYANHVHRTYDNGITQGKEFKLYYNLLTLCIKPVITVKPKALVLKFLTTLGLLPFYKPCTQFLITCVPKLGCSFWSHTWTKKDVNQSTVEIFQVFRYLKRVTQLRNFKKIVVN